MRFFLLNLWVLSTCIYGQSDLQITFQFTRQDGLSNNAVYSLYEDSRGFLWIVTREGLSRYDGVHFKSFYHHRNATNSLPHNKVLDILEYQPGLLLLGTANGLSVLNTLTGSFENWRVKHGPLSAGNGSSISSLYQDPEGYIWVNHTGEIDVLDQNLEYLYRLTDLKWAQGLKGVLIVHEAWQRDSEGRMWLPTDTSGIQIIDFRKEKVYNRKYNPENLPYLQFKYIRALLLDEAEDAIWVAPWGDGVYQYDLRGRHRAHQSFDQPLRLEEASVNALVRIPSNHILCSSNGVLYEMHPATLSVSKIASLGHSQSSGAQKYPQVVTILKSTGLHYWIGTTSGLFLLEHKMPGNKDVLIPATDTSECVDLMVASNNMIYAIYENGLLIETDRFSQTTLSYSIPSGGTKSQITHFCEDLHKRIWIGVAHSIVLFDLASKQFVKPPAVLSEPLPGLINMMYCDTDGDIWIGTRGPFHLYQYAESERQLKEITNEVIHHVRAFGENTRISSISQESNGNLWMRSVFAGGLILHNKMRDEWTLHPPKSPEYNLWSGIGVMSLYPDENGYIWLSTHAGGGLIKYNYTTLQAEQFSMEDGILSNYILHILGDKNLLWLTTEYGISQFNKSDQTIISQNWSNVSMPFEAVLDTQSRELIVATSGKQLFLSTAGHNAVYIPPPVIDAIYVNNECQFIDPATTKLKLQHDQHNITIAFTTGYVRDAAKLRFAYLLEGADQGWHYSNEVRVAQYATLAPGNYDFRIKVVDVSGKWGESVDAFSFSITPPFWKSLWFLVIVFASVLSFVTALVRRRIQTIRYEAGLKQQIAETEMMALRAQMNPHFIFNCINSIDALIQSDDKHLATHYLNRFARLIRNVLDSSRQNTVTLARDMETLELYLELEQFRHDNRFEVQVIADPMLLQDDYKVPPLIVQPFVENAIHHGLRNKTDGQGILSISLQRQNGHIRYLIEDNGVGRAFAMSLNKNGRQSYGTEMSQERVRLFNQEESPSVTITDLMHDGVAAGTRVEILLKMQ